MPTQRPFSPPRSPSPLLFFLNTLLLILSLLSPSSLTSASDAATAPYCCKLTDACVDRATPQLVGPDTANYLWGSGSDSARAKCFAKHPNHCMISNKLAWYCLSLSTLREKKGIYVLFCPGTRLGADPDDINTCPLPSPTPSMSPTVSLTASPSLTSAPTSSPSAMITPTPTSTETETASATPSQTPSGTSTPSPSYSPTPLVPAPYCCNLAQECVDRAAVYGRWTMVESNALEDRAKCRNENPGHCMVVLGVQWYCMSLYDFRLYLNEYVQHCLGNVLPTERDDMDECPIDAVGEPVVRELAQIGKGKQVRQDLTLYHVAVAARVRVGIDATANAGARFLSSVGNTGRMDTISLTPGHALVMPPHMFAQSRTPFSSSQSSSASYYASSATDSVTGTTRFESAPDCCSLSHDYVKHIAFMHAISAASTTTESNADKEVFDMIVPHSLCEGQQREQHCMLQVDTETYCMAVYAFGARVDELAPVCEQKESERMSVDAAKTMV